MWCCSLSQVAWDIFEVICFICCRLWRLCYIRILFDNALYAADSMAWRIVTCVSVSVAIPTLMAVRNIKRCSALWLILLERYTILFAVVTSITVMGSLSVTMKQKRFHPKKLLVWSPIARFLTDLCMNRTNGFYNLLGYSEPENLKSFNLCVYIVMMPYSQHV